MLAGRVSASVALLLSLLPVPVRAAEEFAPEHGKVNTGDATPVGASVVEVEVGYAPTWSIRRGWGEFEDTPAAHEHRLGVSVTWGPTDDLDFAFESGYGFIYQARSEDNGGSGPEHGYGHTDDTVGARYRFLSTGNLDLALTTGFTFPTGAQSAPTRLAVSQGYYSWDSTLVGSADAGHATGNLEFAFSLPLGPDRGSERGTLGARVAGGYHVLEWLQPELEVGYERSLVLGPDTELVAVTAGVVIPWGEGNRIMAGVEQAVWGRHTSAFTGASLAYKAAF